MAITRLMLGFSFLFFLSPCIESALWLFEAIISNKEQILSSVIQFTSRAAPAVIAIYLMLMPEADLGRLFKTQSSSVSQKHLILTAIYAICLFHASIALYKIPSLIYVVSDEYTTGNDNGFMAKGLLIEIVVGTLIFAFGMRFSEKIATLLASR